MRAWLLAVFPALVVAEVLTPPYFNLAENRRITATATCGENVPQPELYCKLVGANVENEEERFNLIQGQICDYCDPNNPAKWHPPQYAIDGSEKWWQSPPISRGMQYNRINLTVDLGQLYQVAYVLIKMGNSPRPGIWVLERSVDNGLTYSPWQYFADSLSDCEKFFGKDSFRPIVNDDDVTCTTQFSKVVPLEGGEIVVSLLNERPSAKNFFNSTVLQEFTRATNVRLSFLRTKTLLGHLMSVARQDPTVTRRYFYSVKDISIGGRCVCNGHAGVCDIADPNDPYKLQCRCQHDTCGDRCETCCPGFIQKKWRPSSYSDAFVCEPCNCHEHSNECIFDEEINAMNKSKDIYGVYEGGGVCQNCQDNTEGINCEKCIDTFYRPAGKKITDRDGCRPCQCFEASHTGNCADGSGQCECKVEFMPPYCDQCNFGYYDYPLCKPCDCFREGTEGGICEVGGGQCPCKENYKGLNCNECRSSFYGFPDCTPCTCSQIGSNSETCDAKTGQCECISNFGGQMCERCEHGYYNYPQCAFCNCDSSGTTDEICNKESGDCLCKEGFSGKRCDNSAPGFWGYPLIKSCECHAQGSIDKVCDADGYCRCFPGYDGPKCDQCKAGFFNFPDCKPCNCESLGSNGNSCDENGKCYCKFNFAGEKCDKCQEGFYIFPRCEECNCNPAGVIESFVGCDRAPEGSLCVCKPRVTGRICDQCEPLYWNLQPYNPDGCEECSCNSAGTLGGLALCDSDDGQCVCKPLVTDKKCSSCKDGTFNLMEDNLFGCLNCGCNVGGSLNSVCNKVSGNCNCRPRVMGQRCDKPIDLHYFPNFHHLKYEAEDGRTEFTDAVRFGYDDVQFPGYSWRGYAIFSDIQKETIYDVVIERPSLYRMIFSYRNPHEYAPKGKILITPESPSYTQQEFSINYPSTPGGPELMTVSTESGMLPLILVMDPGHWTISIQSEHDVLLDYFVLLPSAYYEGSILTENVTTPCLLYSNGGLCLHYSYPDITGRFPYTYGTGGMVLNDKNQEPVETFDDPEVIDKLKTSPMAWLSEEQSEIQFQFQLMKKGPHVILLNYFTPGGRSKTASVIVQSHSEKDGPQRGQAILYDCAYSWTCRQVVMDVSGKVGVVNFDTDYAEITVKLQQVGQNIAIESVSAVPFEDWHTGLVTPGVVCAREDGECVSSQFSLSTDTTKVEFESNPMNLTAEWLPPGISDGTVLVHLNESISTVDVTGSLREAGDYVFVVHYYQPNLPGFDMDVLLQNGKFYESKLSLDHCPSIHGCRAVVTHKMEDGNIFNILENFVITLERPINKEVWVDYLLVVPAGQYSPDLLKMLPRDNTNEFISRCGHNHFKMGDNSTGFCRDAAFALSVEFNGGALYCDCDYYGSHTIECEEFGGACPCKPNVIGRKCERCRTGYFGFPNCQACDCPSTALCNPRNGECICPPLVYGERCDQCVPNTYGYDTIIGCEECQCNRRGVRSGNLQCDLVTGQCDCMDNVVGKRCDRCASGYWTFPHCQSCNCDIRGTEADICNQNDASCYCKTNVRGRTCDTCTEGAYNLEETNPDGCTNCFCFGKTSVCSPSKFYWDKLYTMIGWSTVQLDVSGSSLMVSNLQEQVQIISRGVTLNTQYFFAPRMEAVAYIAAADRYLGNRITSYGGMIFYTIQYQTDKDTVDTIKAGDVIITGNNITAVYFHSENLTPMTPNVISVRLNERNFRTLSGGSLTREQFMMMLHKLSGIYIRAHYTDSTEAKVSDVTLDLATTQFYQGAEPSQSVEQCRCPVNYQGTSCEECAPGFYRTTTGPFGGFCVPCQCNRHSDTCDPITGKCLDCQHNTVGDHCELCGSGYHGDATQQTPNDCLLCACPIPAISNNFADSCIVEPNRPPICECQSGYVGEQCQQCAPGHFGNPRQIGSYCRECECNDNIDPTDQFACDDITGKCLRCLNHTYGNSCEVCEPSYYGDAIIRKDCRPCECNLCGTHVCDHQTGSCSCHNNVVGALCDQCAPDHWGLDSCQGCQSCQCGIAAISSQCNLLTGNCECAPGAEGRYCDKCKQGYWALTNQGCQECSCREGFSRGVGCDPLTGECSCLPGVQGENCDGCPNRWVLIDGEGCRQCPDCIHTLLDTAGELETLIMPTINEFESAAHSFFLNQRLNLINESTEELRPAVDDLNSTISDLKPLSNTLDNIGALALMNNVKLSLGHAKDSVIDGVIVREDAEKVTDLLQQADDLGKSVVDEINTLVVGLETGRGAQLEQALLEARTITEKLESVDLKEYLGNAEEEFETANEVLDGIRNFSLPLMEQNEVIEQKYSMMKDLQDRVDDIEDYISASEERAVNADVMNGNNKEFSLSSLKNKLKETNQVGDDVEMGINEARNKTDEAQANLDMIKDIFDEMQVQQSYIMNEKRRLNRTINTIDSQIEDSKLSEELASEHTNALLETADRLDSMLADTREVSQNALEAANAYTNIANAINDAKAAAENAKSAGRDAVEGSEGIKEATAATTSKSQIFDAEAVELLITVERELEPQLIEAQLELGDLKAKSSMLMSRIEGIDSDLTLLEETREKIDTNEESNKATEAWQVSEMALNTIDRIASRQEEDAEVVRKAFNDGAEAVKSYEFADEQSDRLVTEIPKVRSMAVELMETETRVKYKSNDLGDRIKRLKTNIQKTRELANKVKVGVDFQQDTTLEVVPPEDPSESATSNSFSLYTRTEEPSGLLMFVGTPVGGHEQMRRTKTDDFMALEIVNGFARLTIDLGSGPDSIENRNVLLSDNVWRKISVDRTGMVVRLNVHYEDSDGEERIESVERVLPGRFSVLNLSPKLSRVFVGGIPADVEVNPAIQSTSYVGQVEDVMINSHAIGMWNFLGDGTNNINGLGADERNRLVDLVPPTGLRFVGSGYAAMNTGEVTAFHYENKFDISLRFKTFSENGLLFFMQISPTEYLVLSLVNGHVRFQLNLGSGSADLKSRMRFNDGEWHRLEAARQDQQAVIKVDGRASQGSTSGANKIFRDLPEKIYFGGFPGQHTIRGVTNSDYSGCLDEVVMSQNQFDLFAMSKETKSTVSGCSDARASLVSFIKSKPGYVRLSSPEGPGVKLVFKFKTSEANGLLFYTASKDRFSYLTLSLEEGSLALEATPGGKISTGEFNRYNDSEWHVVIATRENNELRLDIDDFDAYRETLTEGLLTVDGPVYFGGVPRDLAPEGVTRSFSGCIGDATLNANVIDFSATNERPNSRLQSCDMSEDVEDFEEYVTEREYERTYATEPYYEQTTRDFRYERTQYYVTEKDFYDASTAAPQPEMYQCALPKITDTQDATYSYSLDEGARFGSKKDSRIEYASLPDSIRGNFKFSLQFQTFSGEGVIFYTSSISHTNFFAIYMKDGKVIVTFNNGNNKEMLTSSGTFKDNRWHIVLIEREQSTRLYIDGSLEASQEDTVSGIRSDFQAPYFFGGVNSAIWDLVRPNMDGTELSFTGCMKSFRMNNLRVEDVDKVISVGRCSQDAEPGVFFGSGPRAHIILRSKYSVGHQFLMTLEIKPRTNNAVVMSIHGRRDFLLLQIVDGVVEFSVDNGKGIVKAVIEPESPFSLCDGNWHSIQIAKIKNLVVLTVDGVSNTNSGPLTATSTDTRHPLFLGSQPRLAKRRGRPVTEKFVGCIKNVTLQDEKMNLSYSVFMGNVDAGTCPLN